MISPAPMISRSALALLFDLLSTPKMELSAEQFNAREEYRELLAARLLTPVSSTPTSVCIDGRDHDILPNATGPGFGYFSAGAGWVSVPMEALQRYRADPLRVLSVLRQWLEISDRSPIANIQHDSIWDLGDTWAGKRKLAVLFLRRAYLPKSMQQLQQALQVFPRRKSAMVLTDVPINTFGPDLPGEPLCTDLMGLIPPDEEMVGSIDKELIADLLGLGIPKRSHTGPVYCSEDGGELVVNGETYHFTGDTLGRSDYQRQYEPILYGWREGNDHYWCGARDQGDVWFFNKPVKNDLHPTMKPVELVERAIRNSSKSRDVVLDLFGGSGSTLIACEKTHRSARLIELDPKYVDVIVRRWQEYSGKQATRALDGRPFDEVALEAQSSATAV